MFVIPSKNFSKKSFNLGISFHGSIVKHLFEAATTTSWYLHSRPEEDKFKQNRTLFQREFQFCYRLLSSAARLFEVKRISNSNYSAVFI